MLFSTGGVWFNTICNPAIWFNIICNPTKY
uniref:Uncharacterized protein n=1 Tax=Anguilla anguilla TaxID=7936 RepID=A0A0E9V3V9_ANGAN